MIDYVGLRVIADPVSNPYTELSPGVGVSRVVDLPVCVQWLEAASIATQLLELAVEIDKGGLDFGVIGIDGGADRWGFVRFFGILTVSFVNAGLVTDIRRISWLSGGGGGVSCRRRRRSAVLTDVTN